MKTKTLCVLALITISGKGLKASWDVCYIADSRLNLLNKTKSLSTLSSCVTSRKPQLAGYNRNYDKETTHSLKSYKLLPGNLSTQN